MATSSGQAMGTALTNGIQDIAALLPLLGTEQCEDHIGSALTNGYLYAAATPLSIFGSLGVARAGFKALLSATSIRRFVGAKILADAGFNPTGVNLSLIMLEEDRKTLCAEKRLASMMADLHLKDGNKITVSSRCWSWNIKMIIVTALSCIVSITPYIHLNLHPNTLTHFVRWVFLVIRATGGFLTATITQLVIQNRVLSVMRKRLILDSLGEGELQDLGVDETGKESHWVRFHALDQRCSLLEKHVRQKLKYIIDLEKGGGWNTGAFPDRHESTVKERLEDLQTRIMEANGTSVLRGIFLVLLFVGIIASVVGYVGCFTAVQSSSSSTEALIWLCLEAGLSVIRIIIWGLNPESDDAPPLELTLKLNSYAPLPTCTRPAEEIEETKILPLVRAPRFLKAITSYAGLLTQFSHPTITLYYTLTRRNDATPESSKRVLYITIFDHTERTTRIYSEDWNTTTNLEPTYFYSADELTVDLEHGILTTKIGQRIQHQNDPIARNAKLRIALAEHYHSILHQVNSGIGNHHLRYDIVENEWTLKLGEKKSLMQKFGELQGVTQTSDSSGNSGDRGDEKAAQNSDQIYLQQRRVEQKVRLLIRDRGKHIEDYMNWLPATIDDDIRMMKIRHIEVDTFHVVELMEERLEMELMLVDEVREWEEKLRESRHGVVALLSSDYGMDAEMGMRLERRWRTDLWERLKDGELAMNARMNAAGSSVSKRVVDVDAELRDESMKSLFESWISKPVECAWRLLFTDLWESAATPSPSGRPRSRLNKALDKLPFYSSGNEEATRRRQERRQKMAIRLRREVDDVEERLKRGLEHCHEFRSNPQLIELTHSNSKWMRIDSLEDDVIKALKRNKLDHVFHLSIGVEVYISDADISKADISDADITRFFDNFNSTSCTSIHFWDKVRIPDLQNLPLNILSITGPRLLKLEAYNTSTVFDNSSHLESRKTTVEFANFCFADVERCLAAASQADSPSSFTLRFFGPESSDQLTLQVVHCGRGADLCLTVELKGSRFTYPITPSHEWILEKITIGNNHNLEHSSRLTFEPGLRNTLTFVVPSTPRPKGYRYYLLDIELLDKNGDRYDGVEITSDSDHKEE